MVLRAVLCCAVALACDVLPTLAQPLAPRGPYETGRLEAEVLAALNAARVDPARYAGSLKTYRGFFRARMIVVPGMDAQIESEEGVVPVDEAIGFLADQPKLAPLEHAPVLTASATDHVADQSVSGRIGHYGGDGSTPGQRAMRHGGGKGVAEVIAYGGIDAADVVRQLIVDDGVADRGHRILLFSAHLRYAGVSCGPHPQFRTMCVIDMADTPDARAGVAPHILQIAQRSQGSGALAAQRR